MNSKNLLLFILVCGVTGISIVLGSVTGHRIFGFIVANDVGSAGLFSGAILGGIAGVAAGVWFAERAKLLDRASSRAALTGGLIGFALAALIATRNLHGPLIPIASTALIGVGTILGKLFSQNRKA